MSAPGGQKRKDLEEKGEPMRLSLLGVANGASEKLMQVEVNQHFPFAFNGAADDHKIYAKLKGKRSALAGTGAD